jgi:hypothetical protein
MAQGITFTSYIPTSLVGVNSPSPTLAADPLTNAPIPTGALPGNVFFLTESQANQLSTSALTCHTGWYAVVKVDASAVAANIVAGAIGAQLSIPTTNAASQANIPPSCVVTDAATANTAGLLAVNPVVFLGAVTPGNYTIVQISGDGSLLLAAGATTTSAGVILVSTSAGTVTSSATMTSLTAGVSEQIRAVPAGALTLSAAAAASGGTTVYTGTITGGGTNAFAGVTFVVAGFTTAANNGTFLCTASSTTTLTLANTAGAAETHAGTATPNSVLIRANISFPFGII